MKKILLVVAILFMAGCDGKLSGRSGKDDFIDTIKNQERMKKMSGSMKAAAMKVDVSLIISMFLYLGDGQCNEEGIEKLFKNFLNKDDPMLNSVIALAPELCENGVYVKSKGQAFQDYVYKKIDDEFVAK